MEQGRTEHACDARDAAKEITTQDYQVLRLMREMDYGHLVITVKGRTTRSCRGAEKRPN